MLNLFLIKGSLDMYAMVEVNKLMAEYFVILIRIQLNRYNVSIVYLHVSGHLVLMANDFLCRRDFDLFRGRLGDDLVR
tara:strand:- start:656 stop:889 length:234 start_codon:yes stop_codon:yes gene_type:complete